MEKIKSQTINVNESLKSALIKINNLPLSLTLFVLDNKEKLVGTLTDGDIRRGFIKGYGISTPLKKFLNENHHFLVKDKFTKDQITAIRNKKIKLVPIVDEGHNVVRIFNFQETKTILPLDAVIMAGGEGQRLRPMTEQTPKPLLKIGGKAIIDYNFDRLLMYGIRSQNVTVKYLGSQIVDFCNKKKSDIQFSFTFENEFLGTMGAVKLIPGFENNSILIMNSDLLTNLDYEGLYNEFVTKKADMIVASVPYEVNLPYAIFELDEINVLSFKEKPQYTYFANAGIYIIKKELIDLIPDNKVYNATDLMDDVIRTGGKLVHYPIREYWLDIGKPEDFEKAQQDIAHINFD